MLSLSIGHFSQRFVFDHVTICLVQRVASYFLSILALFFTLLLLASHHFVDKTIATLNLQNNPKPYGCTMLISILDAVFQNEIFETNKCRHGERCGCATWCMHVQAKTSTNDIDYRSEKATAERSETKRKLYRSQRWMCTLRAISL